MAIAERHDHVLSAHMGVLYAHVAIVLTPDVKRTRKTKRASILRANAQHRNGQRTGHLLGCAHLLLMNNRRLQRQGSERSLGGSIEDASQVLGLCLVEALDTVARYGVGPTHELEAQSQNRRRTARHGFDVDGSAGALKDRSMCMTIGSYFASDSSETTASSR